MGSLFSGLSNLLKEEEPEAVEPARPQRCPMDAAMQEAIEQRAARGDVDDGPNVTVVRRKSGSAFGRRGT